jgi:hypothetical protein
MGDLGEDARRIPKLLIRGSREAGSPAKFAAGHLAIGDLRALAVEPGTGHACSNSRLLAVAFIESVLAAGAGGCRPVSGDWGGDLTDGRVGPYESLAAASGAACWLGSGDFARKWRAFVTGGDVPDTTAGPAPFGLTVRAYDEAKVLLTWRCRADIESGIKRFNVYRAGVRIAEVPGQGWNRGDEPMPIDCVMAYVDSPGGRTEEAGSALYRVTAVNHAGLESAR